MEIFNKEILYTYQIFGSKSSVDVDVCFFVEDLFSINKNHEKVNVCIENSGIQSNKKINANLAILRNGIVVDCFKGEKDELNNALFKTYNLHDQKFENHITKLVDRELDLRVQRCTRSLVSYFTRTVLREEAKKALKGSLRAKIDFLTKIDLNNFTDFGKHGSIIEVYKTIAFQLGITLALFDGIELYTKESIIEQYPELKLYVLRETSNPEFLNEFIKQFVLKARKQIIVD